ncbi:MAG TPA: hypothetical protein VMF29_02985 [Candidatus Edwardsbacteria bacterium]|nr:hypothetical protein [Candidatus Edwardsbacteria bacterium]
MKATSLLVIACLLLAGAPVCRAQQAPPANASPDTTSVTTPATTAAPAMTTASDSTAKNGSTAAIKPAAAQPAAPKTYSHWWRKGILAGAGLVALIALIIAAQNYHDL